MSVISNGQVEITIEATMREGRTIAGLSPAVDELSSILSHWYVMLQSYNIKNITSTTINNLSLFQMMHGQPNDDYGPNNYGVYDPTPYINPDDGFPEYHYDITLFGADVNWDQYRDDIIGFSSAVPPNAWGLGEFPSIGCSGGEPGSTSLHHLVEGNTLSFGSLTGPAEVAGVLRWDLGDLSPGQSIQHTVLFSTGHSPAGLPISPGLILLNPELATNETGTSHSITATVTLDGSPVEGVELVFEIIDGPHQSISGNAITNAEGIATFSYSGTTVGVDLIRASGDTDGDATREMSNIATKEWVPPKVKTVLIDIKPGSYPNCFNINGAGVIPVAILGSSEVDITQIDVNSLSFAGLSARIKGNGSPQCSEEDVSGDFTNPEGAADGFIDLVCQFVDDPNTWTPSDGKASIEGMLLEGTPILGTDEICIQP